MEELQAVPMSNLTCRFKNPYELNCIKKNQKTKTYLFSIFFLDFLLLGLNYYLYI